MAPNCLKTYNRTCLAARVSVHSLVVVAIVAVGYGNISSTMTWETESTSSEQTEQLAAKLGANLRGGEAIELVSDLGGGKTTFTRGLVRGSGSEDKVQPNVYATQRICCPALYIRAL